MLMPVNAARAAGRNFAVVKSAVVSPSLGKSFCDPPTARSILATFATAQRLRANAQAGTGSQPLRGKNLALLLGALPEGDVATLRSAAQALGARVADLRFTRSQYPAAGRDDVGALARVLGRMYDAIDCEALPPADTLRIEQAAGVPVYCGLCLDEHQARILADLMTLHEHRSPPGASIRFLGDPKTARGSRFVLAAREAGFEVLLDGQGDPASKDATFVVDARHSPRWSLLAATGPLDEARRAENHRCVIQTVLLDTIVKA